MHNIILEDFSAQYIESSDQYICLLIQGLVMYIIILEDFSAQYIELSDQYIYLLIQRLVMLNMIPTISFLTTSVHNLSSQVTNTYTY